MALSGKNFDFNGPGGSLYYCDGDAKSTTACGTSSFTIRNATYHTWLRTGSFKTGGKNVTKIRLWAHDTSATSYYGYKGILGLSSTLYNPSDYSSSIPSFTYSGQTGTNYYETYTYNTYYVDLNVNLNPNTDYYMYVGVASGGAWQAVNYHSSSRYTHYYVEFLESTDVTYTVTYNANGGSGAPTSQTKTWGANLTLSSTKPTRTGYTFLGWSTSSTATSATWAAGATYSTEASNTLYAVWTLNSGTVYYYANGGTATSSYPMDTTTGKSNTTSTVYYTSTAFNLFNCTTLFSRTGYHIESDATAWRYGSSTATTYFNQASQDFSSYLSSSTGQSFNLYAAWVANTYTVSYNGNGSTGGSTSDSSHTYGTETKLTTNGFTRTGYTFTGWNDSADGSGTSYTNGQSVSNLTSTNGGTVTLYAIWAVDVFTVSFSINQSNWTGSGYGPTGAGSYSPEEWVNIDCVLKDGYKFINWTDNNNSNAEISTGAAYSFQMPNNDVSYKANVEAISYSITYEANGGIGTMSNSTHTYDKAANLTANTFTREGYTFLGWSEDFSATTATYTDKQSVKNLTTIDGATITLYAIWTPYTRMYIYAKNASGILEWLPAFKYVYNTSQGYVFTVYQTASTLARPITIYDETETTTIASADSTSPSNMLVTMLKPNTTYKLYISRNNGYAITPTITGSCEVTLLMNATNYKSYQISNITSDVTFIFTYDTSTQE